MATNNNGNPPSSSTVDAKFDDLISLVMRRSRGEVENDDIENAINSIIGAPSAAASSARKVKNNDTIFIEKIHCVNAIFATLFISMKSINKNYIKLFFVA